MGSEYRVVGVRLSEAMFERIRALRPHASYASREATLSKVVRKVLRLGLRLIDAEGPDILHDVSDDPEDREADNDNEETTQ